VKRLTVLHFLSIAEQFHTESDNSSPNQALALKKVLRETIERYLGPHAQLEEVQGVPGRFRATWPSVVHSNVAGSNDIPFGVSRVIL
jgi:hypothetical protein